MHYEILTLCFVHQNLQDIPNAVTKGLRSGEYDAHSSAAIKPGVFCHRNCCVAFAQCDGTTALHEHKVIAGIS